MKINRRIRLIFLNGLINLTEEFGFEYCCSSKDRKIDEVRIG